LANQLRIERGQALMTELEFIEYVSTLFPQASVGTAAGAAPEDSGSGDVV
jgi:hypothetical protein